MTGIETKIFIGMSRALNEINRATSQLCREYGLTNGQFAVLEALYHKGDLSIGEVQEKILSTSGTIPVIVRNLEKEGFLERKQDREDRRKYILSITGKARELMDILYPKNEEIIISKISIWDEKEQKDILNYMKKFSKRNF